MSVFATAIVSNPNKKKAQELTSFDMFTSHVKKGVRNYWISSGMFSDENYNNLLESGLLHTLVTDPEVRPLDTLASLGMKLVVIEE